MTNHHDDAKKTAAARPGLCTPRPQLRHFELCCSAWADDHDRRQVAGAPACFL